MISSVVPEKSPSTRLNPDQSGRVFAFARLPSLLFARAFSGRISAAAFTRDAHSAPDGNAAPTGNVANPPEPPGDGTAVVVGAVVVGDVPTVSVPASLFQAMNELHPVPKTPTFRV